MSKMKKNNEIDIKKIWDIEIEILNVFDKVCKDNNLKYSLAYGTLLGAIRHRGFIPWDDDIDVMMPRKDYNKLLEIWSNEVTDTYIIQNYKTDFDYTNNFSKIRKNHTAFLQSESEKMKRYHKGIFIDIFPVDRVATSKFGRMIQYIFCAINLLYTRGYTSDSTGLIHIMEKFFLLLNKKTQRNLISKTEKIIGHWNSKEDNKLFSYCTIKCCKKYYPADVFEKLKLVYFGGKEYFSVENYDAVLKINYGNYMELPPKEERIWKHHPIVVDYNNNFEEIGDSYEQ